METMAKLVPDSVHAEFGEIGPQALGTVKQTTHSQKKSGGGE